MIIGRELRFPGDWVTPFEEKILDVVLDGEAASGIFLVPLKIDAGLAIACPILGDFTVFKEDVTKVVGMEFANVFGTEIVHYKTEEDGTPLVRPEAGGSGALVVSGSVEALFEYFVGENYWLWKAINSAVDFEIYPSIAGVVKDVALNDKFVGDV